MFVFVEIRKPESSGMLRLCEDLDVRVLAYSPLAQGLLTGKYSKDYVPRSVAAARNLSKDEGCPNGSCEGETYS